jgi:hypothetical protein
MSVYNTVVYIIQNDGEMKRGLNEKAEDTRQLYTIQKYIYNTDTE